jgi:hypothetical protein
VHVRKNKAPVTITRPSDDDLDRLAQAVHAAGVPDQGEVAGWPWSYTPPSRTESRYETVQTTDGSRRQWRPSVEKCGVFWVGAVSGVWTWCKRFDQEVDHDA